MRPFRCTRPVPEPNQTFAREPSWRALYFTDHSEEALELLDELPSAPGQSERDNIAFLRARIFEDLERNDEALAIYKDVSERITGDEARCRYAALLLRTGKRGRRSWCWRKSSIV